MTSVKVQNVTSPPGGTSTIDENTGVTSSLFGTTRGRSGSRSLGKRSFGNAVPWLPCSSLGDVDFDESVGAPDPQAVIARTDPPRAKRVQIEPRFEIPSVPRKMSVSAITMCCLLGATGQSYYSSLEPDTMTGDGQST